MKIGLYSFETMELIKTSNLISKIRNLFIVDSIYLYSENTCKERFSQRAGFKKMLKDYQNSKIDIIVVEDFKSLGKDDNVKLQILKELRKRRIKFICIDTPIDTLSKYGKMAIDTIIMILEKNKQMGEERSIVGERFAIRRKNGVTIIAKDEERMKRCIERNCFKN